MGRHGDIQRLREEFEAARRKGKHREVLRALHELSRLEPDQPRWPHQRGDALRRMGEVAAAVDAFERASHLYAQQGFVARAVAMAKTLSMLDPSRTDVLERVDPSAAKRAHRERRPQGVSAGDDVDRPSLLEAASELRPDASAADDEIRFLEEEEEAEEILELDVSEIELIDEEPPAETAIDRLALMPSFPLLSELPRERLARLAERADLVELPAGALVLTHGEPADALYCIVEGSVAVRVRGMEEYPQLSEGDVFGESCLLERGTRQADVVARERLTALRIDADTLQEAVQGEPRLGDLLFELLARRLVANLLRTSPLFTPFGPEDRRQLARRFQLRRAPAGLVLLERGKRGDALYLVAQGTIEVDDGAEALERGPGAVVGAEGLFSQGPAMVTVSAATECLLLRLPSERFRAVAAAYPPALAYLAKQGREGRSLAGFELA